LIIYTSKRLAFISFELFLSFSNVSIFFLTKIILTNEISHYLCVSINKFYLQKQLYPSQFFPTQNYFLKKIRIILPTRSIVVGWDGTDVGPTCKFLISVIIGVREAVSIYLNFFFSFLNKFQHITISYVKLSVPYKCGVSSPLFKIMRGP